MPIFSGVSFSGGGFQIISAPAPVTNYSNLFDGNGDYLTVTSSTCRAATNQDFTLECWVYKNTSDGMMPMAWANGDYFYIADTSIQVSMASTYNVSASYTILSNVWYHVAVSRSSGSNRIFVNGTQVGSTISNTGYLGNTQNPTIGAFPTGGYYWNGYISNLRFVVGTAVYTSNFTPPTSALTAISNTKLLTCQSSSFIDNSTNNFTITPSGNVSVSSFNPF